MVDTPGARWHIEGTDGDDEMTTALQLATERLAKAQLALRMHEAVVEMHRDAGDKLALRAAQARVNGLRTAVGKAAFGVRCAGGQA